MNSLRISMILIGSAWCLNLAAQTAQPVNTILLTKKRAAALHSSLTQTDPWEKTPDASSIAWNEAATLNMLADLYEATDDARYLDELANRADRVLSHRDDHRGVVDGSGKSRPAWSMGSIYVVAQAKLKGADGQALIDIRSTPSSRNLMTKVELIPSASPGRFSLKVSNPHYKREEVFENLSLDPHADRYVEKIVNDPLSPYSAKPGIYTDKSNLIRLKVTRKSSLIAQTLNLQPIPLAYMGYIGIIYHPMLRLAELVKGNARLKHLQAAADRFVQAAETSYEDASRRLWREGPNKGEGYYLTCERGESFPADNVGAPINFLGRHVSAELALYRLTGKTEYLSRSEKMCRLLKNRLTYDADKNLYTWLYWYEPMTTRGWMPEDQLSQNVGYFKAAPNMEDISHGALDIGMVTAAHQQGIVFDGEDMKRFANTLLKNVITTDGKGVRRTVDGGTAYPPYFMALHGWLELAAGNREVYHAIRQAYLQNGAEHLAFTANLLKWERKLK
jgi:hypothetical protein